MFQGNYTLDVLVHGRPVQEFPHQGRIFVEGRQGTEYSLRFRNNSWKRVMAVFSVDGVEVIGGKKAVEAGNGYIINAYDSIEVKGYRIDEKSVAQFKFADTNQSYAATVGATTIDPLTGKEVQEQTTRNNGVIGVRVFEENVADFDYKEHYKEIKLSRFSSYAPNSVVNIFAYSGCGSAIIGGWGSPIGSGDGGTSTSAFLGTISSKNVSSSFYSDNSFTSSASDMDDTPIACASGPLRNRTLYQSDSVYVGPAPDFNLGTTWGQKVEDKVKTVEFKRSTNFAQLEIFYATRESLSRAGIDFSNRKQVASFPAAFEEKRQFCKVPAWYKG